MAIVCYNSGISAFQAAMRIPKCLLASDVTVVTVFEYLECCYNLEVYPLDPDPNLLQRGDVVNLETPINPIGPGL
jgi:hypothetical protein